MIIQLIQDYFRKQAQDIMPKLQMLERGQGAWQDIYEQVYTADKDLLNLIRRNYEDLNITELRSPAELSASNLGLLSSALVTEHQQDSELSFPVSDKQ